jgi:hypothetical protein
MQGLPADKAATAARSDSQRGPWKARRDRGLPSVESACRAGCGRADSTARIVSPVISFPQNLSSRTLASGSSPSPSEAHCRGHRSGSRLRSPGRWLPWHPIARRGVGPPNWRSRRRRAKGGAIRSLLIRGSGAELASSPAYPYSLRCWRRPEENHLPWERSKSTPQVVSSRACTLRRQSSWREACDGALYRFWPPNWCCWPSHRQPPGKSAT